MKSRRRFGTVFSRRRKTNKARRNRHRRLGTFVERLEARNLLATFVVNSTADGFDLIPGDGLCDDGLGVCTLRGAIQESNALPGADTIVVPAGTYALTIPGTSEDAAFSGDLDITDNVTIMGAGAGSTIVDAAGLDRVFHIPRQVGAPVQVSSVTFDGLTIRGGVATDAGGPGTTFSASSGGGILNEVFGNSITLANSIVTDNAALGSDFLLSSNGQGGGIADAGGSWTISSSQIVNNQAMGIAGDFGPGAGRGGGFYTEFTTTTLLIDTTISNNQAVGSAEIGQIAAGPGQGGGIYGELGTWTMVGSTTVDGNQARGGAGVNLPGGAAEGGGIYSDSSIWNLTLSPGSTISRNAAIGGDSPAGGGTAAGGGIYSAFDTWFDPFTLAPIANNTISGNSATGGNADPVSGTGGDAMGGGIFTVGSIDGEHLTIADNDATGGSGAIAGVGDGGGIFNGALGVALKSTIVANNTASSLNPDVSGVFSSNGYNLIGDVGASIGFGMPGDQVGGGINPVIDPLLGPLQNNGGPTETQALLAGSPAIDAADPLLFPATDQRGVPRPQPAGGLPDIGSVELVQQAAEPAIDIEKFTNSIDADDPTGPLIGVGNMATFTYVVTNTGGVPLTNVAVSDNPLGAITNLISNGNGDAILDPMETWTYQAAITVTPGQYMNTGTVTADDPLLMPVTDVDVSHHFGVVLGIDIQKSTDGQDADSAPGPTLFVGNNATFTYEVNNTGNVALENIQVSDSVLGVVTNLISNGNGDAILDVGETWTYQATAAVTAGQYMNVGTVVGDDATNTVPGQIADNDNSHYFGAVVEIDIEKLTNGVDNAVVSPGDPVTFTYDVTNPGNVPLSNVVVVDDNGTPLLPGDDFNPDPVLDVTMTFNIGDVNFDNKLDTNETWQYVWNSTAVDLGVSIDFETDDQGVPLAPGTVIDDEYEDFGLTVSGGATIFDSSFPALDPSGLVSLLDFNEASGTTAADTSGQGNNNFGTLDPLVGGPVWTGGTLDFDGVDDRVLIANSNDINTFDVAQRSIYVRFKADNAAGGKQVLYEEGSTSRGLNIYLDSGQLYVGGWNFPGGAESAWGGTFLNTAVSSGVWHEAVLVLNGGLTVGPGALKGYLDGNLFGTGSGSQVWAHSGGIGVGATNDMTVFHDLASSASDSYFFDGEIDELRISNPANLDLGTPNEDFGGPGVGAGGAAGALGENRNGQENVLLLDVGGTITFDFDTPVRINNIGLLDIDNPGATVELYGSGGGLIGLTPIPALGSNSFQIIVLNTSEVAQIKVNVPGEKFAVTKLDYDLTYTNLGTGTGQFNPTAEASDESSYGNPLVATIDIEKATNAADPLNPTAAEDADAPTGPLLLTGPQANFSYLVNNTGQFPLEPASFERTMFVSDDNGTPGNPGDDFFAAYESGDLNNNGIMELNEEWLYTASRPVTPGQFTNVGSVTAVIANDVDPMPFSASDPSNHFGVNPDIAIDKTTNGADGLTILAGSPITWNYVITNTGNVALDTNAGDTITVTDDQGVVPVFVPGSDAGGDGVLGIGESWTYTAAGTAVVGPYGNVGTVDISYTDDDGGTRMDSAEDASNYLGATPAIDIEKATNGDDADAPTGPILTVGGTAVFTYFVTNIGNVAFDINDVTVTDSVLGAITNIVDQGNGDNLLEVGETWEYEATAIVTAGQYMNRGTVTADFTDDNGQTEQATDSDVSHYFGIFPQVDLEKFTRVDTNPIDIQKLVRVESPAVQGDVCDILGNPKAITFQYLPGDTVNTAQDSSKASILFDGPVDNDGVSFVVVSDESNASKALNGDGKIYSSGDVAFEEYFNANEDVDSFGSTTYIHFFDDAWGGLLQTVTYHTSCSQPIQLGDVVGNATVAGYEGESGSAEVVDLGPGINDADADRPTGPEAKPGDTVVFTYVVSNPIAGTQIENVQVTDEVLAPVAEAPFSPDPVLEGGFNVGDTNMNKLLDSGEQWLYTSHTAITQATVPGQYIDKATVVGTKVGGGQVMDVDPAHFIVGGGGGFDCECDGPIGGVDLGSLTSDLFFFGDGRTDANWQGATKGFVGNVSVNGIVAAERTSGGVPYAGTIFTNDSTLGAWQGIVNQNAQATASKGNVALIAEKAADLNAAFIQINGLTATAGYESVTSTALDGLNTQDGFNETFVINVTSGFNVSSKIDIIGDAGDVFVLRWDSDANFTDGYEGQVKFQSGGAIVPGGNLTASNFIHVAGDINASGGGSTPAAPYPQGPRFDNGQGALVDGGSNFSGGGFFTGYWLTTGAPTKPADSTWAVRYGATASLSNAIFVGGWYTISTKFSLTSGTSGVHVCPNPATQPAETGSTNGGDIVFQVDDPFDPNNIGEDADSPTGPIAQPGEKVTYTYQVTNPGPVPLTIENLIDDNETPGDPSDDFTPTPVLVGGFNVGDVNMNNLVDFGESWYFQVMQIATSPGQHTNTAEVTANYPTLGITTTDVDSSNHIVNPLAIEKYVFVPAHPGSTGGSLGDPADTPTGPVVLQGDEVVFNFEITNLGNVSLTNVQVTDNQLGPVTEFVDMGDGDNLLEPGETWVLTISDIASAPGQQMNVGTVTANSVDDPDGEPLSQSDPAYHFVECVKFFVPDKDDDVTYRYTESGQATDDAALHGNNTEARGATTVADGSKLWVLDKDRDRNVYVYDGDGNQIGSWQAKKTSAENDRLPDKVQGIATDGTSIWVVEQDKHRVYFYSGGASFLSGSHNATSNFSLRSNNDHATGITTDGTSIWVVDDDGSSNRVFKYTVGGTYLGSWAIDPANDKPVGITIDASGGNSIWIVDQDADQIFQYDGATGLTGGSKTADFVFDLDPDNDKAEGIAAAACLPGDVGNRGIDIEKLTNGVDADWPADAPAIPVGSTVTWTYEVANTGDVPFTLAEIEIVDDAGTPGQPGDDFSIASGDIVLNLGSDMGNDGVLSPGEVWTFEATGIAQNLSSTGASTTFDLTDNSGQDGPNGNIRTFTSGGISVNASGFSRDSGGTWEEAYLGAYSGGLGVTDNSEGDGTGGRHRVDNIDRLNYVLFAFSENVIVDRAFLDSVSSDSDLSVWIGTIPGAFSNPVTLSDAVLNGLVLNEVNDTTSGDARWADINSGEQSGNVLVLAASVVDSTPEDQFKISKLDVQEAGAGIYKNIAVVTAGGVTDQDASHYTSLAANPGIDIKKFTNGVNADWPADAPAVPVGSTVTWTYEVENTGDVPFTLADIEIVDDAGTPGQPGDDFSIASGDIVLDLGSDLGNDGVLSPGEVWTFEATGVAENLSSTGSATTFDLTDYSGQDGPNGNIRTFTSGGISVNASGFSRDSGGTWEEAYLGAYSGGLGVTDNSEGDGTGGRHRVDNIDRLNYVLFAFSENVIVDGAFLDSVSSDSDLSVWIGTIPGTFSNPVTLSDAVLNGLVLNETNDTTSGDARWADINSGEQSGNVLVLAASVVDSTPEDQFKISKLDVQEAGAGIYKNIAIVTAGGVTDEDASHYTNLGVDPGIDIEKFTNGVNADWPAEAPQIAPHAPVAWTYEVANTGDVPFTLADIEIVDDAGTPGDAGDDFSIASGGIVLDPVSDQGNDGVLSPGETWVFEAGGIAQRLSASGASTTIDLTDRSPQDGPNGNIRTFASDGISVNASAFSRDSGGTWEEAYLGAFSSGLGVTDNIEGDGTGGLHRVDNIGRLNYVLFAFSENVIVDRAYLDSVSRDSDLSVWIGTIPGAFSNPVTLSDAVLNGLDLNETNNTYSRYARWADINSGEAAGNVLVLAASVVDRSPEDRFKIRKLDVEEAAAGIYKNIAVVTADDVTDADPSHYINPVGTNLGTSNLPTSPGIDVEKFTNGVDADSPAEAAEIAPGATVTWTYEVTNTGDAPLTLADIQIVDDAGTPGDAGDDLSIASDDIVLDSGSDLGSDEILSPGETWVFDANGVAQDLSAPGAATTLVLTDRSGQDGPNGNIRTFAADGISVNASAFSRDSGGAWEEAYLGAFSAGLGVTDNSEGDGTKGLHRVDSVGQENYVLFAFSEDVVVDRAFLDSVRGGSDLSVWIGTIPGAFTNPVTLSDAVLSGFDVNELNNADSAEERWADINSVAAVGNVLVLAASVDDATPGDQFKITKLDVQQAGAWIYKNTVVVSAAAVSDSDSSHYRNPAGSQAPAPTGGAQSGGGQPTVAHKQFFVVDTSADQSFSYDPDGNALDSYQLAGANQDPRGTTITADGQRSWVIDKFEGVYVYDANGNPLGQWDAGATKPEGIGTNDVDIWIVDNATDQVLFYADAVARLSGSQSPTSSFSLAADNNTPSGLTMSGQTIWVVDDGREHDDVFVYDLDGNELGSWRLSENAHPRGITINPGDVNNIWIVDNTGNQVLEYVGGALFTSGTHAPDVTWKLAGANPNPQGIADPPPPVMPAVTESAAIAGPRRAYLATLVDAANLTLGPVGRGEKTTLDEVRQTLPADRPADNARQASLAAEAADNSMAEYDDFEHGLDVFDRLDDDVLFGDTNHFWEQLGRAID